MTATSLAQTPGFEAEAGAAYHAPSEPFAPEKVDLDRYVLVPWVRGGLSSGISGVNNTGRAEIPVAITLTADVGDSMEVARKLTLFGPGDVIGIDPRQVVRREPPPAAAVGDSSTLAHIEFDRPEIPWLYSPEPATNDQLRPWIALVVVDASKVKEFVPATGALPARLIVPVSELPPLDDSWAWAHAQVHGTLGKANVADRLTDAYASQNLSRLICPRRLEDGRDYIACVVPTFESGRRAGIDAPLQGNALAAAWSGSVGDVTLPVYDHWRFSTVASANFEMLARKLSAVCAPVEVGRRVIDTSTPGGELGNLPANAVGRIQSIECALHSPLDVQPMPENWSAAQTGLLRKTINGPVVLEPGFVDDPELPRVGPRVYARFQRGAPRVPPLDKSWFTTINLRPVNRIAAGVGTRVVARDQEKLVEAAWAQVGEVEKANREIDRLQFSRFISEAILGKTLGKLALGPLAQIAHPVLGKLPMEDGLTVASKIKSSATPWAATSSAFRGLTAANGKLSRTVAMLQANQQVTSVFANLIATQVGLNDMRRNFAEPDAVAGLSQGAIETLELEGLAKGLGVPAAQARSVALKKFGNFASAATKLGRPRTSWTVKSGNFDTATLAQNHLARSRALDIDASKLSPGRREALGGYLAQVALVAPAALAAQIDKQLVELALSAIAAGPVARPRPGPVVLPGPRGSGRPVSGPNLDTRPRISSARARQRFLKFAKTMSVSSSNTATTSFAAYADKLAATLESFGTAKLPRTPVKPVASQVTKATLLAPLNPGLNATKTIKARLGKSIGTLVPADWFDNKQVGHIMVAPHFDRPMYEALQDYDREWVVANLSRIKTTDFVTLLVSNAQFIEAFMVGLSDEMGRELLWRGYPTDQRGTYFKRFWSPYADELTLPIHKFQNEPLGGHLSAGAAGQVVMMVKGDLIRRYPNAMFMAVRGTKLPPKTVFADPPAAGERGSVAFMAKLADDTLLVGLNLRLDEVDDVGPDDEAWWFLIAEHPSAPRFGLDVKAAGAPADKPLTLNDLDWQDLPMAGGFLRANKPGPTLTDGTSISSFTWGANSAVVARMLLQNPARAAFNAKALTDAAVK